MGALLEVRALGHEGGFALKTTAAELRLLTSKIRGVRRWLCKSRMPASEMARRHWRLTRDCLQDSTASSRCGPAELHSQASNVAPQLDGSPHSDRFISSQAADMMRVFEEDTRSMPGKRRRVSRRLIRNVARTSQRVTNHSLVHNRGRPACFAW